MAEDKVVHGWQGSNTHPPDWEVWIPVTEQVFKMFKLEVASNPGAVVAELDDEIGTAILDRGVVYPVKDVLVVKVLEQMVRDLWSGACHGG